MTNKCPLCARAECFANKEGYCLALSDNDFNGRECVFLKTHKQAKRDTATREKRLKELNRDIKED